MTKSDLLDKDEKFTHHLFDTLHEGLLVLDRDLCVERANASFYDLFRAEPDQTLGQSLYELGNGQWDIPELRRLLEQLLPEEKIIKNYQVEHTFEKIGHRIMLLNARQIDHAGLILLAIEDATERKQALREVKQAKATLEDRVQERTRQLSSDLDPSVLGSDRLTDMLRWLRDKFEKMHNFQTDLQAKTDFSIQSEEVRVILLRILRELLFNVVKHAGTDRAVIKVDTPEAGHMRIHVVDEGSGFDKNNMDNSGEHFGLPSVHERLNIIGGSLKMDSAPGRGTHMTITMPARDDIVPEREGR